MVAEPAPKRRRLSHPQEVHSGSHDNPISLEDVTTNTRTSLPANSESALTRSISPPAFKRKKQCNSAPAEQLEITETTNPYVNDAKASSTERRHISSPIQLTSVEGLPPASNVDTVRLRDIVGDPLIRECWVFNYLFDIDFLM